MIDEEEARLQSTEAAMAADGVSLTERRQQSYFGFEEIHKCFLPDKVSYIEHKTLNEGSRKKYLNMVNREVSIRKSSGDAVMKMAAGDEKHELLRTAIVGWNLVGPDGEPVNFTKHKLEEFLTSANPRIIDIIEKDVRKHNPWLMAEMSVEDIQKQIDELEEMKQVKIQEEEGKDS